MKNRWDSFNPKTPIKQETELNKDSVSESLSSVEVDSNKNKSKTKSFVEKTSNQTGKGF